MDLNLQLLLILIGYWANQLEFTCDWPGCNLCLMLRCEATFLMLWGAYITFCTVNIIECLHSLQICDILNENFIQLTEGQLSPFFSKDRFKFDLLENEDKYKGIKRGRENGNITFIFVLSSFYFKNLPFSHRFSE